MRLETGFGLFGLALAERSFPEFPAGEVWLGRPRSRCTALDRQCQAVPSYWGLTNPANC